MCWESPVSSRLCSRRLRKACRLFEKKKKKKDNQLALVWFSAKLCLFKFALGALGGSQLRIEHTWDFWNGACACQQTHALFSSLEERHSGVCGEGWPCHWGSKPRDVGTPLGTRFISYISRSKGFSRKMNICQGPPDGGDSGESQERRNSHPSAAGSRAPHLNGAGAGG